MNAEHTIVHSQLHPVYLDENSNLTKAQRDALNTILFGQYRRFRRAAAVTEEDEPLVLRNFANYSSAIQEVFDRRYDVAHTISFLMSVSGIDKGGRVRIGTMAYQPTILFQAGGTGVNNSESLPGYFTMENDDLYFNVTAEHQNNYFLCYLFWLDN